MKFTKEELTLENALSKEWIITNGVGGFASSTIIGAIRPVIYPFSARNR